jgi:hypothetical protein
MYMDQLFQLMVVGWQVKDNLISFSKKGEDNKIFFFFML